MAIEERNMGAVSLTYDEHRVFWTTGSSHGAQATLAELSRLMSEGKYAEAIDENIGMYLDAHFFPKYKKGVMDALLVHEANKLLTSAQRLAIIRKYTLDAYDRVFEADKERVEALTIIHK